MREHPADKRLRIATEKRAAKMIGQFFDENPDTFRRLVELYSDAEAVAALADLRERFWGDPDGP